VHEIVEQLARCLTERELRQALAKLTAEACSS
jgi:hypothetical protein